MKIIPVLDIQGGQTVRGIGGRRHEYRPIVSQLCASSDPRRVAEAFRAQFGLRELYLADLDAIGGSPPALELYTSLKDDGIVLWVDAGIRDVAQARTLAHAGIERIVVGLETVPGPEALGALCRVFPGRIIFSLDLKAGKALTEHATWIGIEPRTLAASAVELGVEHLLLLDLCRVGEKTGTGTEQLCAELRLAFPRLEISAGGGVRGLADLLRLQACGVDAVLVASALHDGLLRRADVERIL